MRIGILSDTHLGHAWGTPRQDDTFIQMEEALGELLKAGAEVILHAGDMFDSSIPRPEVMSRAMSILSECHAYPSSVKITSWIGRQPQKNKTRGVSFIAIHGTHERRPKGMVNPIQILEKAGLCTYLHCSGVSLDHEFGVFGMGGVPERYAYTVLKNWSPSSSCPSNILLLHQLIKEIFNPPGEPATIGLQDLPQNFLTVCGHIHWPGKRPNVFLPGSTVRTQMGKTEPNEKKVYIMDTQTQQIQEIVLKTPRAFFYEEVQVTDKTPQQVKDECLELVKKLDQDQRAMMKIKLKGRLSEGFEPSDLNLSFLKKANPLLYIDRSLSTGEQLPTLPEDAGLDDLLSKAIEQALKKRGLSVNTKAIVEYLLAGDMDKVMEVLLGPKSDSVEEINPKQEVFTK